MKPVVRKPINDPVLSFFDDFLSQQLSRFEKPVKDVVPSVNIMENDKEVIIDVAAPGLSKKDFEISVENNLLTISAHKEVENLEEGTNYIKKEFGYENFQRTFTIPEDIFDVENIKATYKTGVLQIVIPKREEQQKKVKKIQIS